MVQQDPVSFPAAVHTPHGTCGTSRETAIASVETIAVRAPLPREFRGSHYRMSTRATLITRVHTVSGLIGEAYVGDEDEGLERIQRIVMDEIAPRLVGQDLLAVERCWELAYPVTFDILRDRRLGLVALAAVDTAIWDGVGKELGQPLWRLWGGYSNRVPIIAIGGYYGEPLGTIEKEIGFYRDDLGLAGVKFKIGGATPADDAVRVRRARAAAGPDWTIAVDANQGYTVQEAVEFAELAAESNIAWFEEPVRWHNDCRGLRDVRYLGRIPVCAGQSELSPSGCRDLMEAGATDFCNFDASWSGGPTAWRRAASIATAYDVKMGHHEEPQVSAHLLASQPHGGYMECFHPDRDPFWWKLIASERHIADGHVVLSDEPGFGWELDWEYANRYRVG
jgi:D-galactarolactone cycloisomerase